MVVPVLIILYGGIYIVIKLLQETFSGCSLTGSGKSRADILMEDLERQGIRFRGTYAEEAEVRRNMPVIANIKERNEELNRRCREAGFLSTDERCKYYEIMFPKKKK